MILIVVTCRIHAARRFAAFFRRSCRRLPAQSSRESGVAGRPPSDSPLACWTAKLVMSAAKS